MKTPGARLFSSPLHGLLDAVFQHHVHGHMGRVRLASEAFNTAYRVLVQIVVKVSRVMRHPVHAKVLQQMLFGTAGPTTYRALQCKFGKQIVRTSIGHVGALEFQALSSSEQAPWAEDAHFDRTCSLKCLFMLSSLAA